LVYFTGPKRAYNIYYALVFLSFLSIDVAVSMRYINILSLSANLVLILNIKSGKILRLFYDQKEKMLESSRLTVLAQNIMGIILIIGVLL